MKSLVVYKSISGFTKKYAEMIASQLNADCIQINDIKKVVFSEFDVVVFGGSLHAVGINGFKQFRRYMREIGDEKIVVFSVGASPAKKDIEAEIKNSNFITNEEKPIPLFYLRGGFDYSKLDAPTKLLMALWKIKLMLKQEKSPDEKGMLNAYKTPLDATHPQNVESLVSFVKNKGVPGY